MEFRRDYLVNKASIIVPRGRARKKDPRICPYCPGNERETGPADLVLISRGRSLIKKSDGEDYVKGWCVRAFMAREPIVDPSPPQVYSDYPLYSEPSYGYHYVVVATPEHGEGFHTMDIEQWLNVLTVIQEKVKWLYNKRGVSYVSVTVNYGKDAGANVDHAYIDLITFSRIPPKIEEELRSIQRYRKETGHCLVCRILGIEKDGPRHVLTTGSFVSFCPWAPAFPNEFWIAPLRHETSFIKISQKGLRDLGLVMRASLGGMVRAFKTKAYNIIFHLPSEKKTTVQFHWHIEICPVRKRASSLERGLGIYVSDIPPERSASLLSNYARKELACLLGVD